jgi:hypothetical protein
LTFTAVNNVGTWPSANGYVALTLSVGTTTSPVTMNAASITPAGASKAYTTVVTTLVQYIYIAARATITAHGFNGSLNLIVPNDATETHIFSIPPAQWAVIDANTIAYNWGLRWPTSQQVGYSAAYAGQYSRDYTPGSDRVRTKKTKTYYLPGMTLGVNSETDIPVPDPLTNDAAFLSQVVAVTSGFLAYDANPLGFYKGPIYEQEVIAIDMANV